MAYFVVVTSWIGHYKSSTRWKYTESKSGILRFTVSIFILYLYYYLVTLVNTLTNIETKTHFGVTFVYVLPMIFIAYLLYDIIKNREYSHERGKREKEDRSYRLIITVLFLGLFIAIAIFYEYVIKMIPALMIGDYVIWNPFFIGVAFATIFGYRYKKWKIREKRHYKKREQGSGKDKLG